MKKYLSPVRVAWGLFALAMSIVAYVWRAEFVHSGNVLLFVLAPYYLWGVDERPVLIAYALTQLAYYGLLAALCSWTWRKIFGE